MQYGDLTPFISMQNHHNLICREEEQEMFIMFPTLKMFGVGCTPWSPLARGLLTRPLGDKIVRGKSDFLVVNRSNIHRLEEVAKKKGASMAQITLAWSIAQDILTAPIVGTTSLKPAGSSCDSYLGAINITLTAEERKCLEEPHQPKSVFGHR
ncbi:NADP-dependent oxidoreductase domain-containing protein [Suillus cothurnatus]|nr:NADP-dependent oxidoreductase domain-containing protein [Suillus cothurnatus]